MNETWGKPILTIASSLWLPYKSSRLASSRAALLSAHLQSSDLRRHLFLHCDVSNMHVFGTVIIISRKKCTQNGSQIKRLKNHHHKQAHRSGPKIFAPFLGPNERLHRKQHVANVGQVEGIQRGKHISPNIQSNVLILRVQQLRLELDPTLREGNRQHTSEPDAREENQIRAAGFFPRIRIVQRTRDSLPYPLR